MNLLRNFFNKTEKSTKPYKTGLCLSGGGALGFAHIGVLQALNEHDIFPNAISGSSMGAIIGTLYAAGYAPKEMLQLIKEEKLYKITNLMNFKPAFWKKGFSDHSAIFSLFHELIPHDSFHNLKIPMHICVANLDSCKWEIKSSGDKLSQWVAASASIPGVFNSIDADGITYVDGGLLNNLPVEPLIESCEKIIAVDVLPYAMVGNQLNQRDILISSIRASLHQNSKRNREHSDYLIEPRSIEKYHEFDFDKFMEIYDEGYKAAEASLQQWNLQSKQIEIKQD